MIPVVVDEAPKNGVTGLRAETKPKCANGHGRAEASCRAAGLLTRCTASGDTVVGVFCCGSGPAIQPALQYNVSMHFKEKDGLTRTRRHAGGVLDARVGALRDLEAGLEVELKCALWRIAKTLFKTAVEPNYLISAVSTPRRQQHAYCMRKDADVDRILQSTLHFGGE